MDSQQVDLFMIEEGKKLPDDKLTSIRTSLELLPEDKWPIVSTVPFKSPTTALILSILVGTLGIDRFYIGDVGMGIGKILTCGGAGIWTIIDWFLITKATKDKNLTKMRSCLSGFSV